MKEFIITTDINGDVPQEMLEKYGIRTMALHYMLDGEEYSGNDPKITPAEFYDKMRNGSMPQTMQVNPAQARETFEQAIKEGYDILHIGFATALSGSTGSAVVAANELKEDYPDSVITVIDSAAASLGEGMLVHKAAQMKEAGKSLQEIAEWVEENKTHACHFFTVDDLNHLARGGRLKKSQAVLGTMMNVKPILFVDDTGSLKPLSKTRGRKQSLNALVQNMKEHVGDYQNDTVYISHGDCMDDVEYLKDAITKEFGIDQFVVNFIGPTIGAHSGPGTVALFFMGEKR